VALRPFFRIGLEEKWNRALVGKLLDKLETEKEIGR
jgi:hypothetical protein